LRVTLTEGILFFGVKMQYNSISTHYQIRFWYDHKDWNETMDENVVL